MIQEIKRHIKTHWKALIGLFILLGLVYMVATYVIILKEDSRVYNVTDPELSSLSEQIDVGIVFGGGISDEGPRPLLRDRLDMAKTLLDSGVIEKLILSGDNRYLDYNEPQAMYTYLVDLGVDEDKLQADFAGRSTYETCERATKVFSVKSALLISESTHLSRAIYLCRHFGINAYGVTSDGQASDGLKVGQRWREVLARSKAVFNVYIYGEETVLGNKIEL